MFILNHSTRPSRYGRPCLLALLSHNCNNVMLHMSRFASFFSLSLFIIFFCNENSRTISSSTQESCLVYLPPTYFLHFNNVQTSFKKKNPNYTFEVLLYSKAIIFIQLDSKLDSKILIRYKKKTRATHCVDFLFSLTFVSGNPPAWGLFSLTRRNGHLEEKNWGSSKLSTQKLRGNSPWESTLLTVAEICSDGHLHGYY